MSATRITPEQLRGLVADLGIAVAPGSPVSRLVAASGAIEPPDPAWTDDDAMQVAIRVLCEPRQILVLQASSAGGAPATFLHAGGAIVRFDAGSAGVSLTPPCDTEQFADLVLMLADPGEAGADAQPIRASVRFLAVLRGLRDAPGWETEAELRTRVGATLAHPEKLGDVFEELSVEGALERDGDLVRPARDWLSWHEPLLAATGLKLVALEREDLEQGIHRPRALTVIECRPRRIAFLPATSGDADSDTLIDFEPLVPEVLRAGVATVLAPPARPPLHPVAPFDGDPRTWLPGAAPARPADAGWRKGFWERMVADGVPEALRSPGATLELERAAPGRVGGDRHVVCLTATSAAEWTSTGSRIRWRPLTIEAARGRIGELLPAAGASVAAASAQPADPPGAPEMAIRASVRFGTQLRGVELFAARDAAGGLWRLEEDQVMALSRESILAEIASAFSPRA